MTKPRWYLYIIKAENGKLYTGITTDIKRRFFEHQNSKKGAKFFRTSLPKRLLYTEKHPSRSAAQKREHYIKGLSRAEKIALTKR